MKIVAGAIGLLMYAGIATAQSVFPSARDFNPCPGGKASLRLNLGGNPGLDQLIVLSNLIIRGRVANVLPPVSFNLNQTVTTVETDSLILVEQARPRRLTTWSENDRPYADWWGRPQVLCRGAG
jgi:hypothetical protein